MPCAIASCWSWAVWLASTAALTGTRFPSTIKVGSESTWSLGAMAAPTIGSTIGMIRSAVPDDVVVPDPPS